MERLFARLLRLFEHKIGFRKHVIGILLWLVAITGVITFGFMQTPGDVAVFQTVGWVGDRERQLMIDALLLSIIVIVPVFVMLFGFAWKYREGAHTKAKYAPEFSSNKTIETIWWLVPLAIIVVLSVLTWTSSHELDPFKRLASDQAPLKVQVVSLNWKWLFLYPDQGVATVNYLQIPTNRPVEFTITADSPMNSFWIPKLGGQVYAMNGMATSLSLIAEKTGDYYGMSANISGAGFAGMHFTTHAVNQISFDSWASTTRQSNRNLTLNDYDALALPTSNVKPYSYGSYDAQLFDTIVTKYMPHKSDMMMEGM